MFLLTVWVGTSGLACGYPDAKTQARIDYWAQAFGIDPDLLSAVVWVESRYCPNALGKAGEVGLGQIKEVVAKQYAVPVSYRSHEDWNLYLTARYLRDLYFQFKDWRYALAAYNRGPTRVRQQGIDAKGWDYVRRVLFYYEYWKKNRQANSYTGSR